MNLTLNRNSSAATAATLLIAALFTASPASAQTSRGEDDAGSALTQTSPSSDPYASLPATLALSGVIRDFQERSNSAGHPDFEKQPEGGFAHYAYIVADTLDADGKPVFNSGGRKVTTQFRDSSGRNIMPSRPHVSAGKDDMAGACETRHGGAVSSSERFAQWFRDVNGVNLSMPMAITLVRQANTNMYTFNDRSDAQYRSLGGFFPINGQLFGNSGGSTPSQNFHFTYELDTTFVYRRGSGQVFTFTGDDDVFVFIDGKCVIDIGGVHSAVSQTIDLDRCAWLADGRRYNLKFFFAERHRTQSNFRIDTTITLENAELPATSALCD